MEKVSFMCMYECKRKRFEYTTKSQYNKQEEELSKQENNREKIESNKNDKALDDNSF